MDKMKPDQPKTPEPTDRAEESELPTPPCSVRLISPAEVRDAARQVNQDQSTWRNGPAAVAKMVEILAHNVKGDSSEVAD